MFNEEQLAAIAAAMSVLRSQLQDQHDQQQHNNQTNNHINNHINNHHHHHHHQQQQQSPSILPPTIAAAAAVASIAAQQQQHHHHQHQDQEHHHHQLNNNFDQQQSTADTLTYPSITLRLLQQQALVDHYQTSQQQHRQPQQQQQLQQHHLQQQQQIQLQSSQQQQQQQATQLPHLQQHDHLQLTYPSTSKLLQQQRALVNHHYQASSIQPAQPHQQPQPQPRPLQQQQLQLPPQQPQQQQQQQQLLASNKPSKPVSYSAVVAKAAGVNNTNNITSSPGSATNLLGFMGLYVGNLSPDLSKEQLEKIFSKYGEPVKAHRLIRSPVAFIKYENTESPRAAIDDLYGLLLPELTLNQDQPLKLHFDRNDTQLKANYRPTELPPKADNGECYGWRTTVCRRGKNCPKKHIPINRGIDFQMWMIKSNPASITP